MSRALKKTPAELYYVGENLHGAYNLGSEIAAYCFNSAVWAFGSSLEFELDQVESNAKDPKRAEAEVKAGRERVLHKWLPKVSIAEPKAKPAASFADPAKRL
jgi:hypothetical protein